MLCCWLFPYYLSWISWPKTNYDSQCRILNLLSSSATSYYLFLVDELMYFLLLVISSLFYYSTITTPFLSGATCLSCPYLLINLSKTVCVLIASSKLRASHFEHYHLFAKNAIIIFKFPIFYYIMLDIFT